MKSKMSIKAQAKLTWQPRMGQEAKQIRTGSGRTDKLTEITHIKFRGNERRWRPGDTGEMMRDGRDNLRGGETEREDVSTNN